MSGKALFFSLLLLYGATMSGTIASSDGHTMFLLTRSIVERGAVDVPGGNTLAGRGGLAYPKAGIGQALLGIQDSKSDRGLVGHWVAIVIANHPGRQCNRVTGLESGRTKHDAILIVHSVAWAQIVAVRQGAGNTINFRVDRFSKEQLRNDVPRSIVREFGGIGCGSVAKV